LLAIVEHEETAIVTIDGDEHHGFADVANASKVLCLKLAAEEKSYSANLSGFHLRRSTLL
jgi:hypothetical protein